MPTSQRRTAVVSWGGVVFGSALGIFCAVMILLGVLASTLWWTVAAMAILALSHGFNLIAARHRTK